MAARSARACALVRTWHDSYVPFLLLILGLVIVVAVVLVAAGRGGELSAERNDYAPLDIGPVSATDVALLRPPTAAWGYNIQATDEALARIAESIRARDVRIVALEQLVTDLSNEPAPPQLSSPYVGIRRRALPEAASPVEDTRADEPALMAGTGQREEPAGSAEAAGEAGVTWSAGSAWSREAAQPAEMPWPTPPTRPDPTIMPGDAIRPEDAVRPEDLRPGDAGQPAVERQPGPPERSHD